MEDKLERIQGLISELKIAREAITNYYKQICSLQTQLYSKECEAKNLSTEVAKLQLTIKFLQGQNMALQKRGESRAKGLEHEVRKNEVFNQKVMATSATMKEQLMIQEMDSLRKVNRVLLGFVEILGKEFSFDSRITQALVKVAEGVDDRILQLYVDGIKQKLKQNEVPVNQVEVSHEDSEKKEE